MSYCTGEKLLLMTVLFACTCTPGWAQMPSQSIASAAAPASAPDTDYMPGPPPNCDRDCLWQAIQRERSERTQFESKITETLEALVKRQAADQKSSEEANARMAEILKTVLQRLDQSFSREKSSSRNHP